MKNANGIIDLDNGDIIEVPSKCLSCGVTNVIYIESYSSLKHRYEHCEYIEFIFVKCTNCIVTPVEFKIPVN